jgi:DNA-binding MarR family transcriptional regulator
VTQCYALEALVTGGRQRLTALAARLSLDKSTASRVVDALERKGYVTRIEDAGDGRAVALSATSAGRRLHHRIQDELVREQQKVLGDLTPAARRGAIEIIRRLTRAAQRRFSAGSRSAEGSHSSPAP